MFVALQLTEGKVEQAGYAASPLLLGHGTLQHAALAMESEFVAIADFPFLDTHARTMEHYVAVMMAHLTKKDPPAPETVHKPSKELDTSLSEAQVLKMLRP